MNPGSLSQRIAAGRISLVKSGMPRIMHGMT